MTAHDPEVSTGFSWGLSRLSVRSPDASDRILVVDDDPAACRALASLLDRAGYPVQWTSDPLFAFERVVKRPYGLVISDVRMPRMSGPDLVAAMRRARPEVRALLISGAADEAVEREARALGVRIVWKPCPPQALLSVVQTLLADGAHSMP